MKTNHSIVRYINIDECISDMIQFHSKEHERLYNKSRSDTVRRTQKEKLALYNQSLVHKEMKEFWETVTFEPLKVE